jgi:hypothetical protein
MNHKSKSEAKRGLTIRRHVNKAGIKLTSSADGKRMNGEMLPNSHSLDMILN